MIGRKWWTLIAISVATFMLLLDITVVNVALPSIRRELGASFTDLQWVVDAYTLTLAALVLTAALAGCGSDKERGQYRNLDKPQAADSTDKEKDKDNEK